MKKLFAVFAGVAAIGSAHAVLLVDEGFDDVSTLTLGGWSFNNASSPIGTTDWFQGLDGIFNAQAGPTDSYIAANYENVDNLGTIDNWMMTPTVSMKNGDTISFWTRTAGTVFPDRLQLRMSLNGASSDAADFSTLLVDINPTLDPFLYPDTWTKFSVTVAGLGAPTVGRFGFRYFVTDAGIGGANADYIGVDTVQFDAVPEPATLTALAVGALAMARRRRKA